MASVTLIAEDAASDPRVREVYDQIRRELGFGMVPNLFLSMASRPAWLEANWNKFRSTVLEGELPRTLKEMVGILISTANNSQYALKVHLHSLSALGISESILEMLVEDFERCPLPPRDKVVLAFGRKAGIDPHGLGVEDFEAMRQASLSEGEIYEVLATANLFTAVNQYTDAISLEIDSV